MTTKGRGRKPKRVVKQWAVKIDPDDHPQGGYFTRPEWTREIAKAHTWHQKVVRIEIRELP